MKDNQPTAPDLSNWFLEFSSLKTEEERESFWQRINEKSASREALTNHLLESLKSLSTNVDKLDEKVRSYLPA
jgi:hypothetical protein